MFSLRNCHKVGIYYLCASGTVELFQLIFEFRKFWTEVVIMLSNQL